MKNKLYYEDVEVGTELPALSKQTTSRQLVMYCGASEDFTEFHYDKDDALSRGLPAIIVQGALTRAFLVQVITDWIGDEGTFKKFTTANRKPFFLQEKITCKGAVSKKYVEGQDHYVECDIWAEKNGDKCVLATALITLPVRPMR
jgi:acyl dehydratase